MTDKITELETLLLKLSNELEQLKNKKTEEISAPDPVFKKGYAYKNGYGVEHCIISKNGEGESEEYPILALRINEESGKINIADLQTFTKKGIHEVERSPSPSDLIHSTERLYDDPTMIDPAECSPEQFNVGWVYQDGWGEWFLIIHIWDDHRKFPIIGSDIEEGRNGPMDFTSLGKYLHSADNKLDLILSTGKPFPQWKNEQ